MDTSPSSKGTSSGRRTKLQNQQREFYREQLIRAAERVFCRKNYALVSIDDIVTEAGVSRATFYRHFSNKTEIVTDLTGDVVGVMINSVDIFRGKMNISKSDISDWVELNLNMYRDRSDIIRAIREAGAVDPKYFEEKIFYHHQNIIKKLGQYFNAFKIADREDSDKNVKMIAHFLVRQLHLFCYDVVVSGWSDGAEIGRDLVD